jgi:putative transposase
VDLTWQNRPLEGVYPFVYLDALQFKVRDGAHVRNKAIYVAIGVKMSGLKEVLGLWVAQTEGAKFWLQVMTELKNRGVQDIFIACVDGLKGFPEAIETVFPRTEVQSSCRNCRELRFVVGSSVRHSADEKCGGLRKMGIT